MDHNNWDHHRLPVALPEAWTSDNDRYGHLSLPAIPSFYTPATPATAISPRQLEAIERMNRVDAMKSVMAAQADMAADWLKHRYPGERNIRIEYSAESRERRFLFARGEKFRASLEINIW